MTSYTGLGLTSGTSLDGLDVCCAEFTGDMGTDIWSFRILEATTVPYDDVWRERLANAPSLSGLELIKLHYDYAHFMGKAIQEFMKKMTEAGEGGGGTSEPRLDFVATHGHTVFHQPDQKLTFQLGEGEILATYLRCPLITNFRVKDVCLGGQGAPLAGSSDRFLFSNVALCLNLGGIANIHVREDQRGWDVCACNIILNRLAKLGDPTTKYDKDGQLASKGKVQQELLVSLEELGYYQLDSPKSMGTEWIDKHLWPLLDNKKYSVEDLARTYVEHIASQISSACLDGNPIPGSPNRRKKYGDNVVLVTGGGAHNTFLMQNVKEKLMQRGIELEETVEAETIDYKEAVCFAFLGMRCMLGRVNVFADSTGGCLDSVSGSIHQPVNPTTTGSYPRGYRFLFRQMSS